MAQQRAHCVLDSQRATLFARVLAIALAETIMNKIVTILVCAFIASSSATAATLDAREIAQVKLEITSMYDAFEHGDAKALLAS